MDTYHESPLTSADLEEPPRKRQRSDSPEPAGEEPESTPCEGGTCDCKNEVERRPWTPPALPDGHSYFNIKVKYHKDFDIIEAAEAWFNLDHPCMIVKHIRPKDNSGPHWHIHGAIETTRHTKTSPVWKDGKNLYPHPLREERKKPFSSKLFEENPEHGYMYCVKHRECIGRCPVVKAYGFGPGDMYQIIEQSREYGESLKKSLEKEEATLVAEVLDAQKYADPSHQHWVLYQALRS